MPCKPLFWERFCGKGLRRKGKVEFTDTRDKLSNLVEGLIGEHELTMPPDTDRWDSLSRRTQTLRRTGPSNKKQRPYAVSGRGYNRRYPQKVCKRSGGVPSL